MGDFALVLPAGIFIWSMVSALDTMVEASRRVRREKDPNHRCGKGFGASVWHAHGNLPAEYDLVSGEEAWTKRREGRTIEEKATGWNA